MYKRMVFLRAKVVTDSLMIMLPNAPLAYKRPHLNCPKSLAMRVTIIL